MKENQKLQQGIYSFFAKQRVSVSGMRYILCLYAQTIGQKKPKENKLEWYAEISHLAGKDFLNFKKVYNKNKEGMPKAKQSYDEWWNECNLDGSFAYNGVTDDF